MYRLTLGSLTISDASMPEIVTATAKAGFVGCGMRITGRKLTDQGPTLVGNPALTKEVRDRARDGGIRLSSVTAYHFDPSIKVSDFEPVIEIASQLEAKTFGVACQDPDESRFVDKLAQFAERAETIGARVAIELMPYSQAKTFKQTYRIIKNTGRPNVGLNLDALHLARAGGTPDDIKTMDPKRIFIVQLCDAPRNKPDSMDLPTESRTGRLYPGDGELPLFELLDAIPKDREELECETPSQENRHLPAIDRAKIAKQKTVDFLTRYLKDRGRQVG